MSLRTLYQKGKNYLSGKTSHVPTFTKKGKLQPIKHLSKGLKKWNIDGKIVIAINEKNARRKAV